MELQTIATLIKLHILIDNINANNKKVATPQKIHPKRASHDIVNAIENKLSLVHNKQETKTMRKNHNKTKFCFTSPSTTLKFYHVQEINIITFDFKILLIKCMYMYFSFAMVINVAKHHFK